MQARLLGDCSHEVAVTLCAVVTSYCALERLDQAHAYAQLALLGADPPRTPPEGGRLSPYLVPLLKLSVWLGWKLNKDKRELEARLGTLKAAGCDVDGAPTLLELVVNRYRT